MAGIWLIFPIQQISFFYVPLRLGIIASGSVDEVVGTRTAVLISVL